MAERVWGDTMMSRWISRASLWPRKAEEYLIASGLTYTIVHPGGLLDAPGGKRQLVLGLNDELTKREMRSIPRSDVAQVKTCRRRVVAPSYSTCHMESAFVYLNCERMVDSTSWLGTICQC